MKKIIYIVIIFIITFFLFFFLSSFNIGENNITTDGVRSTGFIIPFSRSSYNDNGEIEVFRYSLLGIVFNIFAFIILNFMIFNYFIFFKNINYSKYLFTTLLLSFIYVLSLSLFENFIRTHNRFFIIEIFYQIRGTNHYESLNNTFAVFIFIILSIFSFYLVLLCIKLYNFIKQSIEKRT